MTSMTKKMQPLLLGLGMMTLGACQHTDVGLPSSAEVTHRNIVQMVRLPHAIKAEEDGTDTLSAATMLDLDKFLNGVNAGYGDTVLLDTADASPARLKAIAVHVQAQGIPFGGVSSVGAEPLPGSVMLYIERHVLTPPDCANWPRETSNNQRNNTSSYFGCATTGTLGLMVANPRDLTAGQSTGNSTSSAVGALYTPKASGSGPSVTMSFDGLGDIAAPASGSGSN